MRLIYSDEWHVAHLVNPRAVVPQSIMPGYSFLASTELDYRSIASHLRSNQAVGVPYSPEQIEHAAADLRAQSNPETADAASFTRRYPKAIVRDFDGKPGMISEMDALVAYMQMLGTLIDLKLYDAKANIR